MSGEKNQVLENMKTRRSIRKYKPDMVPKEIIEKIAEAGTYAATGMGKQSPQSLLPLQTKNLEIVFPK